MDDNSFLSKKGHRIEIRPLMPDDAHHLVDLFEHMGPESRYLRFNMSLNDPDPDLVWSEARRLAQIDPSQDGAWLAFTEIDGKRDVPVGGIRYMRIDEETAEASLVVRDDMQNQGIGTGLLRYLIVEARKDGIRKLVATVQRGNISLWHLLQRFSQRIVRESEGSYTTITGYLDDPLPA
jgi:acetyltransferase